MKDRQITEPIREIPIVSPLLHCLAMPGLVYLRAGFGYVFLRPKSVFFAFTWAFVLFLIYAWNEPLVWHRYRGFCIFASGALLLYWCHLFYAVYFQLKEKAEHDFEVGRSHILRLLKSAGVETTPAIEKIAVLWIEPAILAVAALVARYFAADFVLSAWLKYVAGAIWLKELINHWLCIRIRKRHTDMYDDTEDNAAPFADQSENSPKAARRRRIPRPRIKSR